MTVKTPARANKAMLESLKLASGVVFSTAGLAIKAGGSAIVKAGTAFRWKVENKYGLVAANTDLAALAGTVTNAKFNVFCFFIKSDGTFRTAMGTEGATRAAVKFPVMNEGEACIGFLEINPTGTGNFVGGTTALDDATVVPGAVYVNTPYPFNPRAGDYISGN